MALDLRRWSYKRTRPLPKDLPGQRFRLEPLEPRLLLAADPIGAAGQAVLTEGLAGLQRFAEQLQRHDELGRDLPLVVSQGSGGALSLGSALDLADVVKARLVDPVAAYLQGLGGANATSEGLAAAIGATDLSDGKLLLSKRIDETRSDASFFSFGKAGDAIQLSSVGGPTFSLDTTVGFDLSIGFDPDTSLSPADAFFARLSPITFGAKLAAANVSFPVNLGFLGASVGGGALGLDVSLRAQVANPDGDADGDLTISELLGTTLDALATVDVVGAAANTLLPVSASLGAWSLAEGTQITIVGDPYAAGGLVLSIVGAGADDIRAFGRASADSVIGIFDQVVGLVDEFGRSGELDTRIPLVAGDVAFGDLLGLDQVLEDGLLDPLRALPIPDLDTAQEFAAKLGSILGLSQAQIGARFDPILDRLHFDVAVGRTFSPIDEPLALRFPLDSLRDVVTASTVRISAQGELAFGIDIDLSPFSASLAGIVDLPSTGVLSGDAAFTIAVNGAPAVPVVVARKPGNTNRNQLVADLNAALTAAGASGVTARLAGARVVLDTPRSDVEASILVSAEATNPAATELGLAEVGIDRIAVFEAGGPLPVDGRLASDAAFRVQVNGEATFRDVVVRAADATGIEFLVPGDPTSGVAINVTPQQVLAKVVTKALREAGARRVEAFVEDGRLALRVTNPEGPASLALQATSGNSAVTQLRLPTSGSTAPAGAFGAASDAGGDRALISNLRGSGSLSISAADIDADANFGFVGIRIENGTANATGSLGFAALSGQPIRLLDYFDRLESLPGTFSVQSNLQANLDLPVAIAPPFPLPLGPNPRITASFPNLLQPAIPPTVSFPGLDSLIAFRSFDSEDLVAGLRGVASALRTAAQLPLLGAPLPLVGQELDDLLGFATRFSSQVEALANGTPIANLQTLEQRLEQAFGVAPGDLVVSVPAAGDLRVSFAWSPPAATRDVGLNVPLGSSIPSATILATPDPVLRLDASLTANIVLGFDLSNAALPRAYLGDTSEIIALVHARNVQPLAFSANVGPLRTTVTGSARLSQTGGGGPAQIRAGLATSPAQGRWFLDSFGISRFAVTTQGEVRASLVTALGPETISYDVLNLTSLPVPSIPGSLTTRLQTLIAAQNLSSQAGAVVDGLDLLFASLQQALRDQVFRGNLPLVGDDIGRAMGFLDDVRSKAISRLEQAIASNAGNQGAEFLREQLFLVLGSAPGGLDLIDPTFTAGGGVSSTREDIQLVSVDPAGSQGRIEFRTRLKQELVLSQTPIDFDLGLPGFDLRIDPGSQVLLLLGWQLALTLGVSKNDGVYIGTSATDELLVDFQVRIPDVTARGSVGFLRATIADEDADADPDNRDADGDGDGARNSVFQGTFTVDLRDPGGNDRLTPGELASLPLSQILFPRLEGVADVNLELALGFEPGGEFSDLPRLLADLQVDWIFSAASGLAGSKPEVRLVNGKIDLGRFLATVVQPFVETVQTLTGPVAPVLEILNAKLPVVSDLAGRKITILDLAKVFGEGFATAATFVSAVADVVALAETFDSVGDDVFIDVGALDLTFFDFRDPLIDLTKVDLDIPSIHIDPSSSPGSQLAVKAVEFSEGYSKTTGGGFKFPIFDKPASAFDLIFGKDVDLIRYDVPRLDLGFKYSYSFPLPTPSPIPIVVRIAGKLSAVIDFEVGYDTRGFRTYSQSENKNALLLFDGFFVGDTVDGKDVPEVRLEGKLSAGAGLSIGVAEVGVEGGVFAAVNFNLKDSDGDGKMRGGEIFDNLAVGGPFCIFDVTGEMGAFLGVYWRVGIGPFSISGDYEIARVTLFEFPIGLCDGPPPKLATLLSDGTLLLNMGPRAGDRLAPGDRGARDAKFYTDGDEAFTVSSLTGDTVIVKAFGLEQAYGKVPPVGNPTGPIGPAVLRIVADGGRGNDSIEIEPDILYANQIFGGDGDDVLLGGGGRDEMRGGAGRDTIQGRGDDDTIFGDAGDDVLGGGEGNDTIEGGDGADRLVGGIGNDILRGGAGEDNLRGDEGNDQLFGDLDRDGLYGGIGQDLLFGGEGVDRLEGEDGDDELSGDAGADELIGGRGIDRLYGHSVSGAGDDNAADVLWGDLATGGVDAGAGADLLFGQGGDDQLHGEAGNDALRGGAGADTIFGEAGEDLIFGEAGEDTIFGGAGRDEIHGGQDADTISGGDAEDLIYGDEGNDRIFGDGADDLIFAGSGDDEAVGGLGEDRIFGGSGNDALFGQEGDDLLLGEDGNDRLFGNGGFDVLRGGRGNDVLTGGFDSDRVHGEEGNDSVYGSGGDDWLFGEDDDDFMSGGADDDLVDGGAGNDELFGGSGRDYLLTGSGFLGRSFGGDGDDVLIGSDEGSDDPNFDDAVRFGDYLDGGSGDDTIFGLGGADIVIGGAGNDFVDGGVHGDFIRGGVGDDRIFGALGNDRLEGEAGDDFLDGEWGTDLLRGGAGRDELVGGGGAGDRLEGGDDDDVLRGSDDGADLLFGDAGNDQIFGNGGNDALAGGAGDDVLEGGAGDDLLEGGAGSDVLLGGANHDTLYASTQASPNDEVLVNFLYGDFGNNVATAGQGADRLFGSAGSDILFGEGGDDQIIGGGGAADVVDFGAGEGGNPADFVQPPATAAPAVVAYVESPRATPSLPSVPAASGRWRDLGGSAGGFGVSGDLAPSIDPALVIDALGQVWAAWADARNGNFEIYVARRAPGGAWQSVAGSASGGGVSRTTASSRRPVLLLDPVTGAPIVVWTEISASASDLFGARFDAAANGGQGAWVALGTSLSAGGLSATGGADFAQAVTTSAGPVVVWIDTSTGTPRVYAKRFVSGSWLAAGTGAASGTGLSGASVVLGDLAVASDGTKVAAAWTAQNGAVRQIHLREFNGTAWNALAGSATGAGVSQTNLDARAASVAYLGSSLFVAFQQARGPDLLPSEVYVVRFDGASFVAAGAGANTGAGVSGTSGVAFAPKLASGGGRLHLVFTDESPLRRDGNAAAFFAKRWNGTVFAEEIPGDAQGEGVSTTGGVPRAAVLVTDAQGHPFLAWQDGTPLRPEIYIRGNDFDAVRVLQANAQNTVAQILAGNDLGPGDVIVVAAGNQPGFTVGANDAGVLVVGAPDYATQLTGAVTIDGAAGVVLQRLSLVQDVSVTGANGATLVDNRIGGTVQVASSANVAIVRNTWDSDATGLVLGAGTTSVVVSDNRFRAGTTGVRIAAAASGRIAGNEIGALGTGIEIAAAFSGAIDGNVITGAATGVLYAARAELVGNRIRNGGTGIRTSVAAVADALGFVGAFLPNEVSGNQVGVELAGGRVQGQHVFGNGVGVAGTGTVGGEDASRGGLIERNDTGVTVNGTVQYSRIGHNRVGILATTTQAIHHNELFDNTTAGVLVSGQRDVRIVSNTFYTATGDNVRIENGSSEVDVRNNVLSTDGGYDLYVANDSHAGFFSDWNDLHASGAGKLVFFTRDFADLLDWQADVARYDLHSIGSTGPAPFAATPGFRSYARDDYRVFPLAAQLRATSPTIDRGDPRTDVGIPATPVNLLVNAGFEDGLTGWSTTVGSTIRTSAPAAYDGAGYFAPPTIGASAFAEQRVDLVAAGLSAAQIDGGAFDLLFGGRLRVGAEFRTPGSVAPADRGRLVLIFENGSGAEISRVVEESANSSERWDLVGSRVAIPVGARRALLRFEADRVTPTGNDSYFDAAFLRVVPDSLAPDLGAFSLTAQEPPATFAHLQLRSPDLYTDWERDRPRTIAWQSVGNVGNSPVRIDLLQDGPSGPALVTTIAAATADDGEFVWIPSSSGVAFGTKGLRLQVSLVQNPLVRDRSTEAFSVPEDGNQFYVDDRSNAGDVFTGAATGSNRNTGKRADAPKPNPMNLVRVYDLGPGAVLRVDTGEYDLFETLRLSGSAARGLGLDEAFTLQGPGNGNATARLFGANPLVRLPAIVELDDADLMDVSGFTLEGGEFGFVARGGVEDLQLRNVTATDHTLDAIRVTSNSPTAEFTGLVASGAGQSGIVIDGPLARLADSRASGNTLYGFQLTNLSTASQNARVERLEASGNRIGIEATAIAGRILVGNEDLALGLGNVVSENANVGIYAGNNVTAAGNTVFGQTAIGSQGIVASLSGAIGSSNAEILRNVVFLNDVGIQGGTGLVRENRVYENKRIGISSGSPGVVDRNVVHGSEVGIQGGRTVTGNLVYDTSQAAFRSFERTDVIGNTFYALQGNAIELVAGFSPGGDRVVRGNILVAAGGYAISTDRAAENVFSADFNLFHVFGNGRFGNWGGTDRTTLAAWRAASFGDAQGLAADPLFVDPDGADGALGFVSLANDGRDDDFHLQSLFGSFRGSLAPVRDAVTGRPVFLPVTAATDAAQSPAIDRGAPSDPFASEPAPSGGFANLGAYGNTAQASKSPAQYVLVTTPNGGEGIAHGTTSTIRWRSAGFTGNVRIEFSGNGGQTFSTIAANEANDGSYDWSVEAALFPATSDARIRVTSLLVPAVQDASDAAFRVTPPISAYYVNDDSTANDEYATAVGSDANDGLDPSRPKASLRAILDAYDLGPNDVIYVDTGVYRLTTSTQLVAQDSGVRIQGPTGAGRKAILERGTNALFGQHLLELAGADDITLDRLFFRNADTAIRSTNGGDSDRITVTASDFERVFRGVDVQLTNDGWLVSGSRFANPDGPAFSVGVSALNAMRVETSEFTGISIGIDLSNGAVAFGNEISGVTSSGIRVGAGGRAEANRVHGVAGPNAQFGIEQNGGEVVANEIFKNRVGLRSAGGRAVGNRIYGNSITGVQVTQAELRENQIYGQPVGVEAVFATVVNNVIYQHSDAGVLVTQGGNVRIENNTFLQLAGDAVRFTRVDGSSLRNNVFVIEGGTGVTVVDGTAPGFTSDWNFFQLGATAALGRWEGRAFTDLADWFFRLGLDRSSGAGDARLVGARGADGLLGYSGGADRGRDDDFHLRIDSPAVDRGDPASPWLREPSPNGGRIDLGAYGNTPGATASAAQLVQVLTPNGLDRLEVGETATLRFRTDGLVPVRPVVLVNSGGPAVATSDRGSWIASSFVTEGSTFASTPIFDVSQIDTSGVTDPPPLSIYSDALAIQGFSGPGRLSLGLPVADGSYRLRLHFVNRPFSGEQPFDIVVNGVTVRDDFSVATASGNPNQLRAVAEEIAVTATGGTGLAVSFVPTTSQSFLFGFELLQNVAGTPASPTATVELSTDAGASWQTLSASVPVDRFGEGRLDFVPAAATQGATALVRVRMNQGSQPQDVSDRTFSIAPAGNSFYVNDGLTAGDEYATAIGNNANDGKSAARPMASLAGLLASYDLGPGDTVFVDTGVYLVPKNIQVALDDSGVRIQGPVQGTHQARFERGNRGQQSAVFELAGADDVVFDHLTFTNAGRGILAGTTADSDRIDVSGSEFFDLDWGGVVFETSNDSVRITGNRFHDLLAAFATRVISTQGAGALVEDNEIEKVLGGVDVRDGTVRGNVLRAASTAGAVSGISLGTGLVIDNDVIGYTGSGISGGGGGGAARIEGNRVRMSAAATLGTAISAFGADVIGNDVFGAREGINGGARIIGNRVYGQSEVGIGSLFGGGSQSDRVISGNTVFGTKVGISLPATSIDHNLVYDVELAGIVATVAGGRQVVEHNTVHAAEGTALRIDGTAGGADNFGFTNLRVRNNVLVAGSGDAIAVTNGAIATLVSDYNLVFVEGPGRFGTYAGTPYATREAWFYAVGHDANSRVADPRFVNPAGADGLLGLAGGVDRGLDDDFRFLAGSPVIDLGDPGSLHFLEPGPNGARANAGHLGNTKDANPSASETVFLLSPNGLEKLEVGQSVNIDWASSGLAAWRSIALLDLGAATNPRRAPDGRTWISDTFRDPAASGFETQFSSGVTVDLSDLPGAAPPEAYQTWRQTQGAPVRYVLPVGDGTYRVRLHFTSSGFATGSSLSTILLNGEVVDAAFDPFPLIGGFTNPVKPGTVSYDAVVSGGQGLTFEIRTNAGKEPLRLSALEFLAQDAAGASAPTADLELSTDGGQTFSLLAKDAPMNDLGLGRFAWTAGPETTGNRALLRVTANRGARPADVSDAAFTIANAGTAYYVNDGSLAGDEYATAIGDDANDGKSADRPMASLFGLIRAYDLDAGDVVYVDTGTHVAKRDLSLEVQDSGVRFQGPILPEHRALVDRGGPAVGSTLPFVFEAAGANDVIIDHVSMTGATRGVGFRGFSDGDRWTIRGGEFFGLGTAIDVTQSGDGWRIAGNRIRDVATGIRNAAPGTLIEDNEVFSATGVGISSNRESVIRRNEVYGSQVGIEAGGGVQGTGGQMLTGPFTEVVDNVVRDNITTGISLNGGRAERNQVFGQNRPNAVGISGPGIVTGNTIFGNSVGLRFGGGVAEGNAIFGNSVEGINLQSWLNGFDNQIRDNAIHSNTVGLRAGSFSFGSGSLTIASNRVYANADAGLWFSSGNGPRVVSNTIYQSAGDGLRVDGGSNLLFQSNIVWVDAGAVLSVAAAGQTGFRSDYNDLFTGPAAAAAVGRFGGVLRTDLAAWRTASGGDANSIAGDPLLVDLDGADNVLGEKGLPEGDGFDDNLALRKGSPAIDRGNGYVSPFLDAEGLPRSDDPATPNLGIGFERIVEAVQPGSSFAATGSASFAGTINLPFTFRLYGTDYTQVRIGQSGFLQFGPFVQLGNERDNSLEKLRSAPIIAPLWDEFFASSAPGDGIFVDTAVPDRVTIRWTGVRTDPLSGQVASAVNASVTLFQNGSFRFDYGAGNSGMTPTVGVSAGNGVTFVASQYDGQGNLGGAPSLLFTPTPGLVYFDMGAYEFQGRSDDAVPPRVTNVIGIPSNDGTTAAAFSTIQVAFSEALQGISATSPANYRLVEDGADGIFDTTDDVRIEMLPAYSFPETNVVLTLPGGVLADGRYRLTLSGQNAILDTAGNKLDGNGDGVGGDDFVRRFTIDRSANRPPTANAQSGTVSEDGSIVVTLSATDLDGDTLVYSLTSAPAHGVLSAFDPLARTVTYEPDPDYNGPDAFSFQVDDGKTGVSAAQVTLQVTPVNDAPRAQALAVEVEEGRSALIPLPGSDVETSRSGLLFALADAPEHGSLVFGAAGNWTYTPFQGYSGPDSFAYTVRDGGDPDGTAGNRLTSPPTTVSITVTAAPGVPQAVAQAVQVAEDGSVLVTLGVLADPGVLPVISIVGQPAHGTLEDFDPVARTVRYRPSADYAGPDVFRFRAASGIRGSEAEVTIQVTPVNDAPVLAPIPAKTVKAGQLLTFTATATDVDGSVFSFSLLDAPAGAAITQGGVFTWTPTAAQVAAQPYVLRVVVSDAGVPVTTSEQAVPITVQASGPVLLGDANQDGIVNFSDLAIVRQQFLQTGTGKSADFNGDGVVNFADLAILRQNFLKTLPKLPGDANRDGIVNFADLAILRQQFLQTGTGKTADFNLDGIVNFADLAILRQNFLRTLAPGEAPVTLTAEALPEPVVSAAVPARIERGARIGEGAVIGEGSVVRRDARVGARARLGRDVVVERGAIVPDDAVVLDGTVVPARKRSSYHLR